MFPRLRNSSRVPALFRPSCNYALGRIPPLAGAVRYLIAPPGLTGRSKCIAATPCWLPWRSPTPLSPRCRIRDLAQLGSYLRLLAVELQALAEEPHGPLIVALPQRRLAEPVVALQFGRRQPKEQREPAGGILLPAVPGGNTHRVAGCPLAAAFLDFWTMRTSKNRRPCTLNPECGMRIRLC